MLKGRANDTELPGMVVDEMSFLWLGMFQNFFSEAQEHEGRNMKVMAKQMEQLACARQRGITPKQEKKLLTEVYDDNINVRRDVRRERLAKILKARGGSRTLDVNEKWYRQREPQALNFIAEQEAAADLTLCAEDAAQLKQGMELQQKLPKESEEAVQDLLEARIVGLEASFGLVPDFAAMMRDWEDDV